MYSMPVIVAPAAAVGTGSCQTRVWLRELSGSLAAKASATSAADPSGAVTKPFSLTAPPASGRL
jgi:hypothetical protein